MRNKKELKPYIFISYSHNDINFAKKLCNRLEADDYEIWIDLSDIHGNEEFSAEIEKGIFGCSAFVSLLSKTYINKAFCKDEIECARHYHKQLIPLHIERVIIPPGSGFNLSFSKSQIGYGKDILSDEDFEEFYNDFVETLELFFCKSDTPTEVKTNISFEALRNNFEQLSFGGYVLNEIYTDLFPAITVVDDSISDHDSHVGNEGKKILLCSQNNNKTLIEYIEKHRTNHIFINGEGGSGKTVALRHIFDDFFAKRIPTIYVPLNKVRFGDGDALQKYISDIACKKAEWHNIKQLAMNNNYVPRVVLMLDGLNEITGDIRDVVRQISEMMLWPNLQIIVTSRTDYIYEFSDTSRIKSVKLEPIAYDVILRHLVAKEIDSVSDDKLLHLLSTPMMLTLYTETNISLEYIQQIENSSYQYDYFPIQVTEKPDTSGKIIWNYIVSQLYKVSKQTQSITDTINYFLIVELIMPYLGYNLIVDKDKTALDSNEYKKIMRNLKHTDYYEIYSEDRIEDFVSYSGLEYQMSSSGVFLNIMANKLGFVKKSNNSFEFSHQIFRDFFAALFISKQVESLMPGKEKNEYSYEALTNQVYSKYIIEYLVDILDESKARPKQNSDGVVYPGKYNKLMPSELSIAEKALTYFKGHEGERAQVGVANLFEVMKLGRVLNLSNCDFSQLDLRRCVLMGVSFVSWYKDEIYPCSFDEAFIDIESLISSGHSFPISALGICNNKVFTGDVSGVIKVWTLDGEYPLASFDVIPGEPIIGIAFSSPKERVGILTAHKLYSCDLSSMDTEVLCESHNYYKYVKVDEQGDFLVSTDIEPLTWKNVSNGKEITELPFRATCGCAAKNPIRNEFIIGLLYNNALLFRNENDTNDFTALRRIDLFNHHAHISDVCYNSEGTKFLIATNKTVTEFDSGSMSLLHRISFDGNVASVKYSHDKIVVACGVNIIVLNADFSIFKKLCGKKLSAGINVLLDNGKLFVCSSKQKIHELSENFTVRRSRRISTGNHICVGECVNGTSCFILIDDNNKNEAGYKFDFQTAELSELTWNYEIITECYNTENFPYEIVRKGNVILFTNKQNFEDKKTFVYYPNINIFECSFKKIRGNIKENLETIIMYGGKV